MLWKKDLPVLLVVVLVVVVILTQVVTAVQVVETSSSAVCLGLLDMNCIKELWWCLDILWSVLSVHTAHALFSINYYYYIMLYYL